MDWFQIVLRIGHIVSGVAWVGGAFLFVLYIEPAINKLGPDAAKFVDELINKRKVPLFFITVSTLTVVFGLTLYWRDSNGLQLSWIQSPTGLTFTVGGLAAILAWAGGNLIFPVTLNRLNALGARMSEAAAAGAPPADVVAEMTAVQERLRVISLIDFALLLVAVVAMSIARYVG